MTRATKLMRSVARIPEVPRALALFEPGWEMVWRFICPQKGIYPFPVTIRSSGDVVICDDWHDLTTLWTVFTGGEYRVAREDRTICDLGANFGAFALWASIAAPEARIIAVEPHPGTYLRLRANLRAWGLENRVVALEAAVWSVSGTVSLDGRQETPSHSVRVVPPQERVAEHTLEVPTVRIGELLESLGGSCDLVKMDIEGAEDEVIAGLERGEASRIREWQIEYHGGDRRKRVARHLIDLGYGQRFEKRREDCGVYHFVRGVES